MTNRRKSSSTHGLAEANFILEATNPAINPGLGSEEVVDTRPDTAGTEHSAEQNAEHGAGQDASDAPDLDPPDRKPPKTRNRPPKRDRAKRGDRSTDKKGLGDKVETITRVAASIGVAIASLIGVAQYVASNEDIRSERSLGIVQDWQDNKMIDSYVRIQGFVETRLTQAPGDLENLPQQALDRALVNLAKSWIIDLRNTGDPDGIQKDLERLILFFGQMEICISANLCNADVLRLYFQPEVQSFWAYFQAYAHLRRAANYAEYGTEVDRLVARFDRMSD